MYITRDIEKSLKEAAESFQVITIYGSRQTGKTTTADRLFGDSFNFVTLDDPDELSLALSNPKGFLEIHKWPLIIDEVQKAPGLLNVIKMIVDEQIRNWMRNDEERELMYVLTSSNQFELQQGISESLAGRTAIFDMAGLTQMEKKGIGGEPFSADIAELLKKENECRSFYRNKQEIFELIFEGSYPDVVTKAKPRDIYFKSYVDTYIEKDVRKLIAADSEMRFRRFLSFLALRTAQELNYSSICSDLGINVDTCKRWISILETSGIIVLLEPFMPNMSKRIIKSPKMYFMDTGLCSYLCKWPNAQMLMDCAMSGAFIETYVVSEVFKSFYNKAINPKEYIYYYRDIDKKEVDILLVKNNCLYPVEIKKNESPNKPTKNFSVLEKYKMEIKPGLVVCSTDHIRPINDKAYTFPISLIGI